MELSQVTSICGQRLRRRPPQRRNYPAEGLRPRQPCGVWNPPIGERLIRTGKFLLSLSFGSGILGT